MELTDDQYIVQIGGWTRIMSKSANRARMAAGYERKCREEPGWQAKCRVAAQWSVEDRQEFSAKMKALWNSPEYADRRQAARERLLAANKGRVFSEEFRHAASMRMRMGGAKALNATRKMMQPEAIAARVERDAMIVRNFYSANMSLDDLAALYKLSKSSIYRIVTSVKLD